MDPERPSGGSHRHPITFLVRCVLTRPQRRGVSQGEGRKDGSDCHRLESQAGHRSDCRDRKTSKPEGGVW
jgi:hypothetical protein